ncbi:MAG: glycosyltransferase, partial [Solirubrobacteraceae bacterium]
VDQLRELPGVEVTGYVPDVRPWLARATVAVAPLRIAAGVQTKVLEAMASALPVVTTARALRGLTPAVHRLIVTAETPSELTDAVVQLLTDPVGARRRGLAARAGVIAEYSWDAALSRLLAHIDSPGLAPRPPLTIPDSSTSMATTI